MTMMNTQQYPQEMMKVYLNPVMTFKTIGILVKNLTVGWTDSRLQSVRIYNIYGFPVTDVLFKSFEDGVMFAEFLNKHYEDYFLLWQDNNKADVPGLTRYTIKNGLKIYAVLEELAGKVCTFDEIMERIK